MVRASASVDSDDSSRYSKMMETMYDSDEEPPEDVQEELQWRGDPVETHSDWTIEVVAADNDIQGDEIVDTYHVHKFALAFGARRSEYMENLFKQEEGSESNTTRLELDPLAAKVIPQVLDYIYKPKDELKITTQTASALHYLGQFLGIRRLRWEAKKFWKGDLSLKNVGTYYEHAYTFGDEKILTSVKQLMVKEIMNVKTTAKIVRVSHCDLWFGVLELVHAQGGKNFDTKIKYMSELIAEFATKNINNIDHKGFDKITAADQLPVISYKAAVALMETKDQLGGKAFADLHDRCTTAMSTEWEAVNSKFDKASWDRYQDSKQEFQTELYKKTLKKCSEEKRTAAKEMIKVQKELKATKLQLDKAKGELALYKPVAEKSSIKQRGRSVFKRRSSNTDKKPHCTVEGQKVYFRASVC